MRSSVFVLSWAAWWRERKGCQLRSCPPYISIMSFVSFLPTLFQKKKLDRRLRRELYSVNMIHSCFRCQYHLKIFTLVSPRRPEIRLCLQAIWRARLISNNFYNKIFVSFSYHCWINEAKKHDQGIFLINPRDRTRNTWHLTAVLIENATYGLTD